MIAALRAGLAVGIAVLATVVLVPLIFLTTRTGLARESFLHRAWHGVVARVFGLRIRRFGTISPDRPLLLAANHMSWTDILVLGSLTNLSFIAKSELAEWPVLGALARLQRTVFVTRERKGQTGRQASEIAQRLSAGDVMVLFAEGTTGDGNFILPFKSSLFGAAELALAAGAAQVRVQPVAIVYTRVQGLPLGRARRALFAWIGDGALLPNLKLLLREGALDVEVHFGQPLTLARGGDRKDIARRTEKRIREMLAGGLRGSGARSPDLGR